MRKKVIIGLAVALVACSACVDDERGEDALPAKEIYYRVVQALSARGDAGRTDYPKDVPFGAYAYFLPAGKNWDADEADAETYMNDVAISYDETNTNWHAATTYYWPKQGSLTFFAYSPKSVSSHTGFRAGKEGIFLSRWNVETHQDVDFMVADIAKDKRGNENSYAYNGVPTLFRHKLARVSIQVKLDEAYTGRTVRLKALELRNIYAEGDYYPDSWRNQTDPRNFEQATSDIVLTLEAQPIGKQQRKMIPQAFAKEAIFFVQYEIESDGSTVPVEKTIPIKNISPAWHKNKDITYTLIVSIGSNTIDFDTKVGDWVIAE